MDISSLAVRDLRRRWKPHKERLASIRADHPTAVRFHRACSWLSETETLDSEKATDQVLLFQWIAFNALYGQWERHGDRQPDWIDLVEKCRLLWIKILVAGFVGCQHSK